MSARYSELPEEFYLPQPQHIGEQAKSSKQSRDMNTPLSNEEFDERKTQINMLRYACSHAFKIYKDLLKNGWPRELARIVLPLNTYSVMFTTVNLHNLFGYLSLRNHNHAQYEIRVYAQAMLELIEPIVPIAMQAFTEYGKNIPCDLDNLCEDCGRVLLCAD
jgi:thymidylate synthase (FAD)